VAPGSFSQSEIFHPPEPFFHGFGHIVISNISVEITSV
jgi:hypothetical protein